MAAGGRLNSYQALITGPTNVPPTVSLSSPANGSTFVTPANVTVTATASDSDGGIQSVSFFANGSLIGTSTAAPYSVGWSVTSAGLYSLTAVATDTFGAATTSAAVSVQVNDPVPVNAVPQVTLIAPADGSSAIVGSVVTLRATATDADGIDRVDFYVGNTLVPGTSDGNGFVATWRPTTSAWFTVTARAYDTTGAVGTSASVRVHVKRR